MEIIKGLSPNNLYYFLDFHLHPIFKLVWQLGGEIYGECLRDLICGFIPSKIHVHFEDDISMKVFNQLVKEHLKIDKKRNNILLKYNSFNIFISVELYRDVILKVDGLCLSQTGFYSCTEVLDEVLNNIKKKEGGYINQSYTKQKSYKRMITQGWNFNLHHKNTKPLHLFFLDSNTW